LSNFGPGDRRDSTGSVFCAYKFEMHVEGSYAPNKRERAANVHNVGKKANDVVLGPDVLKVMLLNYIEQLFKSLWTVPA